MALVFCPSKHSTPTIRMNPVRTSSMENLMVVCIVIDVKQELLKGHSVSSSKRGFLDTSVNHFHFPRSYYFRQKASGRGHPQLSGRGRLGLALSGAKRC